jgi:hypothetical protein
VVANNQAEEDQSHSCVLTACQLLRHPFGLVEQPLFPSRLESLKFQSSHDYLNNHGLKGGLAYSTLAKQSRSRMQECAISLLKFNLFDDKGVS